MPQFVQDIENSFQSDVDEIALKAIFAFKLTYSQKAAPGRGLDDPLLRWMDFATRYIPIFPRRILVSKKFPMRLPPEVEVGLGRIERLLMHGGDVNPYQSKTLTLFNDTSGSKAQKRTDGLWSDWGIHHLHLPLDPAAPGQPYSERSDWLLFLMVFDDAVLFIDIKKHGEGNLFSQRELIETYIRSWPQSAKWFQIKGVLGLAQKTPMTDAQHKKLRSGGISTALEVDGKVYLSPGMGITSAVTSVRVEIICNQIRTYTSQVAEEIARPEGEFQKRIHDLGVVSPIFQLAMLPTGDLGIHEKISNECWRFPRQHPTMSDELFSVWHNTLVPPWAGLKVAQYWVDNP